MLSIQLSEIHFTLSFLQWLGLTACVSITLRTWSLTSNRSTNHISVLLFICCSCHKTFDSRSPVMSFFSTMPNPFALPFFIVHILSFDVFFSFSCYSDVTLGSFNPSLSLQMISIFKNKWDSRLFEQKCHKWEVQGVIIALGVFEKLQPILSLLICFK